MLQLPQFLVSFLRSGQHGHSTNVIAHCEEPLRLSAFSHQLWLSVPSRISTGSGVFYPPPFQRSKEFVPHKIVTCWKRKIKGWQAKETLIFFLNGGLEEYIFPQVCDNSFKIHVWETDFHNKDQCTLSTFFCIINPVLLSRIECNLIH